MDAIATVRAVLACDLACDEQDLLADGVRVVLAADRPGRGRFLRTDRVLMIATLGAGTVISCDSSRLQWARAQLALLDRDELFTTATVARISARLERDGQTLAGPDLKFVCAPGEVCDAAPPPDVQVEVVDGPAITPLYRHRGFRHALGCTSDSMRPDVVAAIASVGGSVVGIAGASADCDLMWQIGVDVVEDQRKRGDRSCDC